ncbi:hypothetical protein HJG60_011181 [Phyllostomus discolor]|uniref:Uncharacterized protein n=1 Tax=Phyllostomus discolor TaxID=89673 RepID=A0A833ZX48_9CHIR|nr:hypothetical protein HJG60_011181 [Phyllostomus discolor]
MALGGYIRKDSVVCTVGKGQENDTFVPLRFPSLLPFPPSHFRPVSTFSESVIPLHPSSLLTLILSTKPRRQCLETVTREPSVWNCILGQVVPPRRKQWKNYNSQEALPFPPFPLEAPSIPPSFKDPS